MPFDILLFIKKKFDFRNYWWQTGNPSFLIEMLKTGNYFIPELEEFTATEEVLDTFDVDHIELVALLWQTGYLTIREKIPFCFPGQLNTKAFKNPRNQRKVGKLSFNQALVYPTLFKPNTKISTRKGLKLFRDQILPPGFGKRGQDYWPGF